MSDTFAGLFTGNNAPAPAPVDKFAGVFPTSSVAPTAPAPSDKFSGLFAPSTPVAAPASSPPASTDGIPASALKGSLGGGYGKSNITDPASGKSLLTYENPKAQSSQLLTDRTAPSFDPTVPQKINPADLQNPRMKQDISQALRKQFGATAFQELDHIMPLELGGSNNTTNLRLEKGQNPNQPYSSGKNPTPTDPIENQLAAKAHNGDTTGYPLAQAWRDMAKVKGITLPEDGGTLPQSTATPAPQPGPLAREGQLLGLSSPQDFAAKFPALTQTLADLQTNPAALGSSIKDILATPFTDIKQASDAFNASLLNFINGVKSGAPASQNINNALQAATSYASGVLEPITVWFNAANKIPIIGSISKLLFNVPFSTLGDVSGNTGVKALQSLPITPQAKQNLEPGIKAVSSLAGQILAGKYVAVDALGALTKQFGPTDAKTIIAEAHQVAQDHINGQKTAETIPAATDQPTTLEATPPQKTEQSKPQTESPSATTNESQPIAAKPQQESASQSPAGKTATPEVAPNGEAKTPPKMLIDNQIGKAPTSKPAGALRPIEGTGKEKIRGLSEGVAEKAIMNTPSRLPSFAPDEARSLEQAQITSKLTDMFGDLPTYKQMDVADQGAKAIDLFQKDPETAKQIAYGAKAPPKGLTPEAVFIAVEQDAIERGDAQTLKELANSRLTTEATTMGQRIRMLGERNPEAPTEAIRAIQKSRVEAAKKPIIEETAKAETSIKKATSDRVSGRTKITWDSFVESITC